MRSNRGGWYNVRSLYFDNRYMSSFYENENGNDPREKFRIRIYNHDLSNAKLELKQKRNVMTKKEWCTISEEEILSIINYRMNLKYNHPLKYKFIMENKKNMLEPKIIVDYERRAYIHKMGNVRITLDKCIGASQRFGEFGDEILVQNPIFPDGRFVLEVKWDDFLPDYVYNALEINTLQQSSFSKFYYCCLTNKKLYKFNL